MAVVHKIILSLVHKIIFSSIYKATLSVMRIKTTKTVISLQLNIKPTKPITSTLRTHQVYRVSQDHQEATSHPTGWSLSSVILQSKNLFSKPWSFGFPLLFPAKSWEVFYQLISYFLSSLSQAILQRLLFKAIIQELSFNADLFWKVGFSPHSPIGLKDFSSTRLSPPYALWLEFSKLPNRSHSIWMQSCLGFCS